MSHSHAHGGTASMQHRGRLVAALAITVTIMAVEAVAAFLTGSLALLADAGHMLSDALGLTIALIAIWLAARPASARWTFGFQRAEVLAALVNGVVLTALGVVVIVEGIQRLTGHPEVDSPWMLAVGVVGMIGNVVSLRLLTAGSKESLNLRGAYLEVLGDMLGSAAVIVAAVIILTTGWAPADAVASIAIGVFIVPRALGLLREVGRVLLEGAPSDLDVTKVREHMAALDGVAQVHDVHAWTITSGVPVLTAHVVVHDDVATADGVCHLLDSFRACLTGHFDVEHSTLQIEPLSHARSHPEPGAHE